MLRLFSYRLLASPNGVTPIWFVVVFLLLLLVHCRFLLTQGCQCCFSACVAVCFNIFASLILLCCHDSAHFSVSVSSPWRQHGATVENISAQCNLVCILSSLDVLFIDSYLPCNQPCIHYFFTYT
jgi:hypothetical protein